jgi:lysophospholipase L1-like esterase
VSNPDLPSAQSARERNASGTAYLIDVALGVAAVLVLLEIAASLALARAHFTFDGFETAEEVLLRLHAAPPSQPYVLVLGDSVMATGALRRAGVRNAEEHSMAARLARLLEEKAPGSGVVSLAMEGALANDYAALLRLIETHHRLPAAVVMQVDYRLLSPTNDPANLSREWLRPYANLGAAESATADYKPVAKAARPIDAFVREHLLLESNAYVLLRGARRLMRERALRAMLHQPQRPAPEDEAVLRLLVTRYYRSSTRLTAGRPMTILERTIDHLLDRGVPVLVCFTPANFEFLADRIDVPMYRFNVGDFQDRLRRRYDSNPQFRLAVFEGAVPQPRFLDHTHLDAAGNDLVAHMMLREFETLWLRKEPKT